MTRAQLPGEGALPGLDYASIPGVNFSTLKEMSVSPKWYRWRLKNPAPRKRAWLIGGGIHCLTLEPHRFSDRYVVMGADEIKALAPARNTKEGRALIEEHPELASGAMTSDEYQAACVAAAHPGKEAMSTRQYETCSNAADAIHGHRFARELLRGGLAEETVTWIDPETGIACKGRLDYLRPDLVIDLKSTSDPAPERFAKDAVNYGYSGQVAFYDGGARAAKRLTGSERPWAIVVRAGDDFDVAPLQMSEETLDIGRRIYRSLLIRLAECTAADYWPGVAPEPRSWDTPPWADSGIIETEGEDL